MTKTNKTITFLLLTVLVFSSGCLNQQTTPPTPTTSAPPSTIVSTTITIEDSARYCEKDEDCMLPCGASSLGAPYGFGYCFNEEYGKTLGCTGMLAMGITNPACGCDLEENKCFIYQPGNEKWCQWDAPACEAVFDNCTCSWKCVNKFYRPEKTCEKECENKTKDKPYCLCQDTQCSLPSEKLKVEGFNNFFVYIEGARMRSDGSYTVYFQNNGTFLVQNLSIEIYDSDNTEKCTITSKLPNKINPKEGFEIIAENCPTKGDWYHLTHEFYYFIDEGGKLLKKKEVGIIAEKIN